MQHSFMVYGATGYTGKLIAEYAKEKGLTPLLAGRNEAKVKEVAEPLGLPWRAFPLTDSAALQTALESVGVVIHAAGPFRETSAPMVEACLKTGTHYLDITGEPEVFEACAARGGEARERGIVLMPGVGFDVVPSDCLAAHVASRAPGGIGLSIAIGGLNKVSRGTAKTGAQYVGLKTRVRRGGKLTALDAPLKREFDLGEGPKAFVAVTWGDVVTAFYSTGIPDIDVFFETSPALEQAEKVGPLLGWFLRSWVGQAYLRSQIDKRSEGPNAEQRETGSAVLQAEVIDGGRAHVVSRLRTPEPYKLTALTALAAAEGILEGQVAPGFQTPSLGFGADFILQFEGVEREDIQ